MDKTSLSLFEVMQSLNHAISLMPKAYYQVSRWVPQMDDEGKRIAYMVTPGHGDPPFAVMHPDNYQDWARATEQAGQMPVQWTFAMRLRQHA